MDEIKKNVDDFTEDEWKRFIWDMFEINRIFDNREYKLFIDNLTSKELSLYWRLISIRTGLTIMEFCKRTGLNRKNFSYWINGHRDYATAFRTLKLFMLKGSSCFKSKVSKPTLRDCTKSKIINIINKKSLEILILCDGDQASNKILQLSEFLDENKSDKLHCICCYQLLNYPNRLSTIQKYSWISLFKTQKPFKNATDYTLCYLSGYFNSILQPNISFIIVTNDDFGDSIIIELKRSGRKSISCKTIHLGIILYQYFPNLLDPKVKSLLDDMLILIKKYSTISNQQKFINNFQTIFINESKKRDLYFHRIETTKLYKQLFWLLNNH